MKLYGSPNSPFVRKVRVFMHEKRIPHRFIDDDVWSPESIVPGKNPLSKVPVLELDDGDVLFDSPLVMAWLDSHFGAPIVPTEHDAYWRCMRWHTLANGILDATVARTVETMRRPADKRWPAAIEREEGRIRRALALAEKTPKDGAFLVGGFLTPADIALGVALQYIDFRYPHDWRSGHPGLTRWHAGIVRRESFTATLPPGFTPVA
ncbi:MAG TPA: glutathione S-transferase N-terminal domain-containing protein [Burkholderiales bacterium]|nr:glutathione S-transferase N-terminal domain-containing protein [Burkholderiales bacterium]